VEAYRLRPDRRFLWAVADVHHLLTGQERQPVAVTFREGRWRLRYRGEDVGTLPELPEFGDFMGLLTNWVNRLHATHPLGLAADGAASSQLAEVDRELDRVFAPHVVSALGRLDGLWRRGSRDPGLLPRATRALTLLTLQSVDAAEVGDALPARAAALLALTKNLAPDPMVREEGLLAQLTGHGAHARRLVTSLAPDDPVRLYVTRDDAELESVAEKRGAGPEARYLYLLRLAQRGNEKAWSVWAQAHFRGQDAVLPVSTAGLALQRFDADREFSETVMAAVFRELDRHGTASSPQEGEVRRVWQEVRRVLSEARRIARALLGRLLRTGGLGAQFEADLETVARGHAAPFWDAETVRAHYRRSYYSGWYTLGLHYLDGLSSVEAAREFAGKPGKPGGRPSADFERWYRDLVDFKAGQPDPRRLLEDLDGLSALGARPLMRTLEELERHVGAPTLLVGVQRLVSRMDTRMSHRVHLGHLAHTVLRDLRLSEWLHGSIVEAAPAEYPFVETWYLKFRGQFELLDRLLQSAVWPVETRAEILGRLEGHLGPELLRRGYERLIADVPDSWAVRSKYVDYLERAKSYDEAVPVITGWLERHDRSAGFDYIYARTALARMHYLAGRYEEAWTAVEDVVESGQAGAMGRAALILDRLGRADEAEKLGRALVERYPDHVWARRVLAELYWRRGRHEQAARVLKAAPQRIGFSDWRWTIAPAFGEVFGRGSAPDALAAFSALLGQGVGPFELRELVPAIAEGGNHELAFKLASALRATGFNDLVLRLDAYRNLRAWKGRAEALDWLRTTVSRQLIDASGMIAYDQEEFDLVWELGGDPGRGEDADFAWLMRAAAWVRQGARDDVRRRALADHYQDPVPGHYHALGRFLLGLETEQTVLKLATDAKKRCEIAYYVGLRSEAERRYADASDWYRVTVETGQSRNGEYRWAQQALTRWERRGTSLARLASDAS